MLLSIYDVHPISYTIRDVFLIASLSRGYRYHVYHKGPNYLLSIINKGLCAEYNDILLGCLIDNGVIMGDYVASSLLTHVMGYDISHIHLLDGICLGDNDKVMVIVDYGAVKYLLPNHHVSNDIIHSIYFKETLMVNEHRK